MSKNYVQRKGNLMVRNFTGCVCHIIIVNVECGEGIMQILS